MKNVKKVQKNYLHSTYGVLKYNYKPINERKKWTNINQIKQKN